MMKNHIQLTNNAEILAHYESGLIEMNEQLKTNLLVIMAQKDIRTVTSLSEITGISRPTLTKIIKGKAKSLSTATLLRLCEGLEIDVTQLLSERKVS
jgi:DNA-binding Xre family transcriptional regulator